MSQVALNNAALTQQVNDLLGTLFHRKRLGIDHQISIPGHIVREGFTGDVIVRRCVQALRVTLLARLRRRLHIDRQHPVATDQRLGLFTSLGIRRNERSQRQQARLVELPSDVRGAAPVFGAAGAIRAVGPC